jgi:hypothetical protein
MWGDYFFVEALERALDTVGNVAARDATFAVDPGTGPGER